MSVFLPKPLESNSLINDAGSDIKSSEKIEKYRVSDKAVYIPCGFSWQYLPLDNITAVHSAINLVTCESCSGFEADLPALRVEYGDNKVYLDFNKVKNAERMRDLITRS